MRIPHLRLYALGALFALLAPGCSKSPSNLAGPRLGSSTAPASVIIRTAGGRAIDGAYIVVFKQTAGDVDQVVDELGTRHGISAQFRYKHALRGFAAKLPATAIDALRNDPRVAYIEQDQIAHAVGTQANPPSWGLDRVDQHSLPLDNSYSYNQTGAGVDAYIIDTGIRFTHTDFGGRAVKGVDEITPGGTADDGNGHGTHTAGTTGGTSHGMAKGVRLIAVRVLDNAGSGSYSQVIAGVDWVTADHTTRP
ncbi:MAG: S8 family serine peptidase, partial [Kofleriaceae bacterium]